MIRTYNRKCESCGKIFTMTNIKNYEVLHRWRCDACIANPPVDSGERTTRMNIGRFGGVNMQMIHKLNGGRR